MVDRREALLKAKGEAVRLHRMFSMRESIEACEGRIDVFGTVTQCGVVLLFKPLDSLLGAYVEHPIPGMLITTKRQLSVQRLTAAHELGHARLNHKTSLDDDSVVEQRLEMKLSEHNKLEEVQANTFAIEFMLPDWLISTCFSRYGWNKQKIVDPRIMYQLSLRVGVSYTALCHSLMRPGIGIIDQSDVNDLLKVKPRKIKQNLLKDYQPENMWGDVWELTPKDEGTVIEGSWSDLFLLKLNEHSNSGYIWNFEQLNQSGFAIVRDERNALNSQSIGGVVERSITVESIKRQTGEIVLTENRPWLVEHDPEKFLSSMKFRYDLTGPEKEGLPKAELHRIGVMSGKHDCL